MRGEKTINFDFEILYSAGGKFHPATSITVRAPSLDQYRIHSIMQSWTIEGANGWRKVFADEIAKAKVESSNAPDGDETPSADEDDKQIDVMAMMAAGLSPEKYAAFSALVMDTLKNNPRLAYVGEDPKAAITDHVLTQIGDKGGIPEWERVASEFVGFFMLGGQSAKTNGDASSPASASPTPEPSPLPKRVNSRLKN
jgi:hypothetical protein